MPRIESGFDEMSKQSAQLQFTKWLHDILIQITNLLITELTNISVVTCPFLYGVLKLNNPATNMTKNCK